MPTRTLIAGGLVLLSAVLAAQQAPPATPPAATGLIVGQVVDGTTGKPIPEATVMTNGPTYVTASDGRFVMRGVKPGPNSFRVLKPGYLSGQYGQLRPAGPGGVFTLQEGEKTADVVIKLWRPGSITGRVVDEAGEPMPAVTVRAMRRAMRAGEWRFGSTTTILNDQSARTDDRGIYRLDGMTPGNWIVGVMSTTATVPTSVIELQRSLIGDPSQAAALRNVTDAVTAIRVPRLTPGDPGIDASGDVVRQAGPLAVTGGASSLGFVYPSTFYAGASSPGRATVVTLTPGQERVGVDLGLRPVRTVRVSGTVTGPDGAAAHVPLMLLSPDSADIDGDVAVSSTVTDAAGRFTFVGVVPGPYVVQALKSPSATQAMRQVGAATYYDLVPPGADAPSYWARRPLSVGQTDVAGLELTLNRGVRVSGRVVLESVTSVQAPPDFRTIRLVLDSADGRTSAFNTSGERSSIGFPEFHSIEVPPGRYFIRASPGPWTLVSMMSGGRDVSETPLALDGRSVTDLVATFTKKRKSLAGVVRNARNEPVRLGVAIAFPADRQAWVGTGSASRRFQLVRTSRAGEYDFRDLPAGEYLLAAFDEDPGDDWTDPQLLVRWAVDAVRVTFGDSTTPGPEVRVRPLRAPASLPHVLVDFAPDAGDRIDRGPFVEADEESSQSASPAPVQAPRRRGEISGIIDEKQGATFTPVRRAAVTLSCASPIVGRTIVTDESGTFAFGDLPPCRYTLSAQKIGFLTARYGATGVDRPGTAISLADGQRSTARLTMQRGGVIAGAVRDSLGEPITGALVQVMRWREVNGERQLEWMLTGAEVSRTDGRGEFRAFGLPPGDYIVGATPGAEFPDGRIVTTAADVEAAMREIKGGVSAATPATPPNVGLSGFAGSYHPRTANPLDAAIISLQLGEERDGADITIELVRLSRVSLSVTSADGGPPASVQARFVLPIVVPGFIGTQMFPVTANGGDVMMVPVPPGQYTISVTGSSVPMPSAPSGGGPAGPPQPVRFPQWAIVPVTITGQDMRLPVRLEHGKTLAGRVQFEGDSAPDPRSTSVSLSGPRRAGLQLNPPAQVPSADGAFSIPGIVPASYRIISSPPRGWSIASVTIGQREVSDRLVEIDTDLSDVVVTFTNKTTDLSGTLQTPDGKPAPDFHVIVFPADKSYWIYGSRRIVSLRPGTDGRFVTSTLPPGEYLIGAVTDVVNDEWFNPSFLDALVPGAVKVTLSYGAKTVQDLRIR